MFLPTFKFNKFKWAYSWHAFSQRHQVESSTSLVWKKIGLLGHHTPIRDLLSAKTFVHGTNVLACKLNKTNAWSKLNLNMFSLMPEGLDTSPINPGRFFALQIIGKVPRRDGARKEVRD